MGTENKIGLAGFTVLIYKKTNAQQHLLFSTSLQESAKRRIKAQTA